MDERENRSTRNSGAASRPPDFEFTEDTPLFTDVPYTPARRTGNNGRPSFSESSNQDRKTQSAPYGGRIYSAPSQNTAVPRTYKTQPSSDRTARTAPVYTELSWDDLMRGTDSTASERPAEARRPSESASFPTVSSVRSRSGSQYFGGFDQEMEELFYGREQSESRQRTGSASLRNENADQPQHSEKSNSGGYSTYYQNDRRPQATRRPSPQQNNTPAPARRAAVAPARSQWSDVFGSNRNKPTVRQPAAPSRTVSRSAPSFSGARRSGGGRPRNNRVPPLFLGGGIVLLVLLVFLIARLTGDSSASVRPAAVPTNTFTEAPSVSFEPVLTPEPAAETTPAPTPEPSPTPSGPKAKKSGDLIVPADWGPVIPERSRAVYDSYFDKSCMVGNSLVEGFLMWAGMTNMRYIYNTGATVNDAIGKLDLAPITLNPPGYYENIYLMFGLNEIGTDVNSFVQGYKKLVDFIREYQPTANIVLISVTPVTRQVDGDPNEVQSMDRIRTFNSALQEFCVDQNCWYLDIYHLLLDSDGYLSGDYAFVGDGKHFEKSGYVAWANYMKTHYVDDRLLTE